MEHHYVQHILRMPPDQWPDPVLRAFKHLNPKVYVPMQGPSELGASGILEQWDRTSDLSKITVPTLVIGATHDTMDPAHIDDGEAIEERPISAVPEWQSHGDVRRPADLHGRRHQVHS